MGRVLTSTFIALTFFASVAAAQQPCTTDAGRVVSELYRHVLQRGPDPGAQHWQQQLANGSMTVRDLVRSLVTSQEHMQRFGQQEAGEAVSYERAVATMYRHVLGRQPDAGGQRDHAILAQQRGMNAVAENLVNSQEYTNSFGDWGVPGSGGMRFCASGNSSSNTNNNNNNPQIADNRFRGMDTNNDGVITRREWRGNDQSFDNQDWNGDGVISGDEVVPGARRAARRAADHDFDALDVNNNNRIERREWQARGDEFNRLDDNGDNVLSRAELDGTASNSVGTAGSQVNIDSSVRWTDTGINVQSGQTVTFDADGQIRLSDNPGDFAAASGSSTGRRAAGAPVPNAPAGGLIARIANSAPIYVGDRRAWRAPRAGRLYLGVNDDHLADNEGSYRVTIDVR
jgi:Ca2+-binding EF-hand superfamily protein